ncbi:hypothetical protein [Vibrio sp. SCSIO 43136]|uniref:hypothetical protein n=1 Tax=Vibrio sp. SCSIO 43136 TaxID=2819101 RepID=UPI0020765465|nr:hypothetical protein [Vibrio sp. SCSIO 43136]USD66998.1 hypothetical protein J4N39_20390 [Vibrio sp. SCSIO 43136]
MTVNKLHLLAVAASIPLLTACVTPGEDDPNAATKQGAAGGALLGLTLGALTGDAELAAKGAIAGGVAGGVSGASVDIQNNRETIRSSSRDDAIAGIGGQTQANQPQHWQQLDNFIGEWQVNIQNYDQDLATANAISATGKLESTQQARVELSNPDGLDMSAGFHFSPENGYQMVITNNATDTQVEFAGEAMPNSTRYNFYATDTNAVIYENVDSGNVRVELAFIGNNIWMLESYVYADGQEQKVQTYRFSKQS